MLIIALVLQDPPVATRSAYGLRRVLAWPLSPRVICPGAIPVGRMPGEKDLAHLQPRSHLEQALKTNNRAVIGRRLRDRGGTREPR